MNDESIEVRKQIIKSLKEDLKRAWHPEVQENLNNLIESHIQAINLIRLGVYTGKVEIDIEKQIHELSEMHKEMDIAAITCESHLLILLSIIGRKEYGRLNFYIPFFFLYMLWKN